MNMSLNLFVSIKCIELGFIAVLSYITAWTCYMFVIDCGPVIWSLLTAGLLYVRY